MRFEAEQILTYLQTLESKMDEWSLSTVDMRIEKAELERLHRNLVRQKPENSMTADYVIQLSRRIKTLQHALEERLKR
jgi:hypothetical protein